jgi:hypothetical protein
MSKILKPKKEKPAVKAPIVPVRTVDAAGTVRYMVGGRLHREDGPALEYSNGSKEWHIKGRQHREGGPAVITAEGNQYWMQNGQYHREDGPAIVYNNGYVQYYLDNRSYLEPIFRDIVKGRKMSKALASLEKFADKFGKGDTLDKAGVAAIKFLQGSCDHSFHNKEKECALCDSPK